MQKLKHLRQFIEQIILLLFIRLILSYQNKIINQSYYILRNLMILKNLMITYLKLLKLLIYKIEFKISKKKKFSIKKIIFNFY